MEKFPSQKQPNALENKSESFGGLSQETVEKVLEKTVDIDAPGTAFSVVGTYDTDVWKDRVDEYNEDLAHPISFEEFSEKAITDPFYYKSEMPHAPSAYQEYLSFVSGDLEKKYFPEDYFEGYGYTADEAERLRKEELAKKEGQIKALIEKAGLPTDNPDDQETFNKKYAAVYQKELADGHALYVKKWAEKLKELTYGKDFETFKREYERTRESDKDNVSAHNPKELFEQYKEFLETVRSWGEDSSFRYHNSAVLKKLGLYEYEGDGDNKKPRKITKKEFMQRYNAAVKEEMDVEKVYEKYIKYYNEDFMKESGGLWEIQSIFTHGILGGRRWAGKGTVAYGYGMNDKTLKQPEPLVQTPEAWTKDVRTKDPEEKIRKERHVFFNIVGEFHNVDLGHSLDVPNEKTREWLNGMKMRDSYWFGERNSGLPTGTPKNAVAIIFDKEGISYFSDDPKGGVPRSEHGHAGPTRIAPRKFLGVVVQCTDKVKKLNEYGNEQETRVLSTDPEKWQRCANDIAQTLLKVDSEHTDRLIPIYDISGNMLWPVKMSHEEILEKTKKPKQ